MPMSWKTVRIFISSTFRDMHAERDHLVRVVFPELKERCRKIHVHLIDVDLRWGVSEQDAQDGKALDICLDEIDTCRPFFLGLLGHRYGWIPAGEHHSITAQEIYHGVLGNDIPRQVVDLWGILEGKLEHRPLTERQRDVLQRAYRQDLQKRKYILAEDVTDEERNVIRSVFAGYARYQKDRSFFFFRSEALSRQLAGSRLAEFFEETGEMRERLARLKNQIRESGLSWFDYDTVEELGQKIVESLWTAIGHEVGPQPKPAADWVEEETELHQLFIAERTPRFAGRRGTLDALHRFAEDESDARVLLASGEPGCGKSALFARFTEELTGRHPDWQVISHFVGASAASTSLNSMLRRLCTILYRTCGFLRQMEHRLRDVQGDDERARAAREVIEKEYAIPERTADLILTLSSFIRMVESSKRVVLILDAVDQIDVSVEGGRLDWFPSRFPPNVRCIVSSVPGRTFDALKKRCAGSQILTIQGLAVQDLRALVSAYLSEIRHEFPTKEIESLFFEKVKEGNPLYTIVALEELRVFGKFEAVKDRVLQLPESITGLFNQVLERLETDFGESLVRTCMSLIFCGRNGLTAVELKTLLARHAGLPNLEAVGRIPDMLWARLYSAFRVYAVERSGAIDFFHGQLKEAVGQRYFGSGGARVRNHSILARYFEQRWSEPYWRGLVELPFQLTHAADLEGLARVLGDLRFVEAKSSAEMVTDLELDYRRALLMWPGEQNDLFEHPVPDEDEGENIPAVIAAMKAAQVGPDDNARAEDDPLRHVLQMSSFVSAYSARLSEYPGETIPLARNHARSGYVVSQAERLAEKLSRPWLARDPRPDPMPSRPACMRQLDEGGFNTVCVTLSSDGKWAAAGNKEGKLRVWDLSTGDVREPFPEQRGSLSRVVFSEDGTQLLSASLPEKRQDYIDVLMTGKKTKSYGIENADPASVRVWDVESGALLRSTRGIAEGAAGVATSFDLRMGLLACVEKAEVWDLVSGRSLRTLQGYSATEMSLAMTPDGRVGITGGQDREARVWDILSGTCLRILHDHTSVVSAVAVTPDARFVACGCGKEDLEVRGGGLVVWDLQSGKLLKGFEGHEDAVTGVWLSPDGRLLLSAGEDEVIRAWDVASGECIRAIQTPGSVMAFAVSRSGKVAVTLDKAGTLHAWNIATGRAPRTFRRKAETPVSGPADLQRVLASLKYYTPSINGIAVLPPGREAVACRGDCCVTTYDLNTGDAVQTLTGHQLDINDIANATATVVVTAASDNQIRVWDTGSGKCMRVLKGHTGSVHAVAITPDGRYAVSGANGSGKGPDADHTMRLWDLADGTCLKIMKGHKHWVMDVAFTPDARTVVSGSTDHYIRVWDVATGECRSEIPVNGTESYVERLTLSHDGRRAYAVYLDGCIRVWDTVTGESRGEFGAHRRYGTDITLSPDDNTVASSGVDGTVRVWDAGSGQCLVVYHAHAPVSSLSSMRADGTLVCGTVAGEVQILKLRGRSQDLPIVTGFRPFRYPDSRESRESAAGQSSTGPGAYGGAIVCVCPWCGDESAIPADILARLEEQSRKAGSQAIGCLALAAEEFQDPVLVIRCTVCGKQMRLNPFALDKPAMPRVSWRNDPVLRGKFHPEYPDAVAVIVHEREGGIAGHKPVSMWVELFDKRGDVYVGTVRSESPLSTVSEGDTLLFVAVEKAKQFVHITPQYLEERKSWRFEPCRKCGFPMGFEPPSVLLERAVSNPADRDRTVKCAVPCPVCDGQQMLVRRDGGDEDQQDAERKTAETALPSELIVGDISRYVLFKQAALQASKGNSRQALALYAQQGRICRQTGDVVGYALCLANQALQTVRSGASAGEALKLAEEAHALCVQHRLAELAEQLGPVLEELRRMA
jgi:WD40 repeat protein